MGATREHIRQNVRRLNPLGKGTLWAVLPSGLAYQLGLKFGVRGQLVQFEMGKDGQSLILRVLKTKKR